MVASHAEDSKVDFRLRLHRLYYARGAQGVLRMRVEDATSQLDPPSLMPISVAGCGRLQLGVPHWATSVDYYKKLIIDPSFCGHRLSIVRFLVREDFTLLYFYRLLATQRKHVEF